MKIAVVQFLTEDGKFSDTEAKKLAQRLGEENYAADGIFFLPAGDKEKYFLFFDKIRQAYDNVFVIKCGRNGFDESDALKCGEVGDNFTAAFAYSDDSDSLENFIRELGRKYGKKYGKDVFKIYGVGEEEIKEETALIGREYGVKTVVSGENSDFKVELIYDESTTKMNCDGAQKRFLRSFGENVYAYSDMSLAETLVSLLKLRKKRLSVAESFTGGRVSGEIVSVSGASEVFYEGIVSYNENSKAERLGVKRETLSEYRPVSRQVAAEMAKGLVAYGNADIAVSTTGIAGPKSDDSGFPVGLCFIGVAAEGKITVYKKVFDGDRETVIKKGVNAALFAAIKVLKNL